MYYDSTRMFLTTSTIWIYLINVAFLSACLCSLFCLALLLFSFVCLGFLFGWLVVLFVWGFFCLFLFGWLVGWLFFLGGLACLYFLLSVFVVFCLLTSCLCSDLVFC